jgi:hypothetical protein
MSNSVIGLCDAKVVGDSITRLPDVLTETLKGTRAELREMGFPSPPAVDQWSWHWKTPFGDGDETEVASTTVGLCWPNSSGIVLICARSALYIRLGVTWDILQQDDRTRGIISAIVSVIAKRLGAFNLVLIPENGDSFTNKALDMFFAGVPGNEIIAHARMSSLTFVMFSN